jgi:hypothetical protein
MTTCWFFWLLVTLMVARPFISITEIGKPRKPVTKGDAILFLVLEPLLIAGLFYYWGK